MSVFPGVASELGDAPPVGVDHPDATSAGVQPATLRVLVVDDDDVDRMTVTRGLRRAGIPAAVDEAATTAEALRLVATHRYDCVFLDYNIPGGNGATLLCGIKGAGMGVPVVMLTGQGDEKVAVELMKAGATDYLPKAGLSPERLAQSLRYAVELARASDAAKRSDADRRASAERTSRLQLVTERLSAALSEGDVAALFLGEVRAAVAADTAWLAVVDTRRGVMRALGSAGYVAETARRFEELPLDAKMPANDVVHDAHPRTYPSRAALVAAYPDLRDALDGIDQEAVAILPLVAGGTPFGVMSLGFRVERVLDEADLAFTLALARQCAQALERARLYEAERSSRAAAEAARREAEDANRTKSEFLARMSHDLRTPLNAIGGYAELIEIGVHGPVTAGQRESLARVRRAQQHLLTLINDILSFARLEAGQVQIVTSDVLVAPLLAELGTLLQPQAETRGLSLLIDAGPPELMIRADRERVLQVLLNLGTNALKFTPHGEIRIEALADDTELVSLRVSDSGIGIPLERLTSIFDPFTQVHGTAAEREGGVGLGLAISRELAQRMGGALSVESAEQQGSRFTVLLPRGAARST